MDPYLQNVLNLPVQVLSLIFLVFQALFGYLYHDLHLILQLRSQLK